MNKAVDRDSAKQLSPPGTGVTVGSRASFSRMDLRPPNRARPFLRWVGGKQNLVSRLLPLVAEKWPEGTYREPFLGAGSLFFALEPGRSELSDINLDLVQCYEEVRDQPLAVAEELSSHALNSSSDYYYEQRDLYNSEHGRSPARAARFIYLNRTCYNGVFRVNKSGEYNVPYGRKEPPLVPSKEDLLAVSEALKMACLKATDFRVAVEASSAEDFVYVDPPYPANGGTSCFTHYTPARFHDSDQEALAEILRGASDRGVKFMMSNADTPLVRRLYSGFFLTELSVTRFVTCCKTRSPVREVIVTNYDPRFSA